MGLNVRIQFALYNTMTGLRYSTQYATAEEAQQAGATLGDGNWQVREEVVYFDQPAAQ